MCQNVLILVYSTLYLADWNALDFPAGVVPFGKESGKNLEELKGANDPYLKLASKVGFMWLTFRNIHLGFLNVHVSFVDDCSCRGNASRRASCWPTLSGRKSSSRYETAGRAPLNETIRLT